MVARTAGPRTERYAMTDQPHVDVDDVDSKVEAAIEAAIAAAVAAGSISSDEDAFVILQPSGHITVMPKSEAPGVDELEEAVEDEPLPPFELPAMYRDDEEARESLVDTPYYDQHLSSNWGF